MKADPWYGIYGHTLEDKFANWLYGEYDEKKLHQFELLYATPVHYYMDYLLDRRADEEYLNRYGMDYSDIHDPRKLRQTSSSVAGLRFSYNFISSNVEKLYK